MTVEINHESFTIEFFLGMRRMRTPAETPKPKLNPANGAKKMFQLLDNFIEMQNKSKASANLLRVGAGRAPPQALFFN